MKKKKFETIKQYFELVSTTYGYSKYQKELPYLQIEDSPYSDYTDPDLYGEYCAKDNELVVYWKNVETVEDIIRVLIHEYQHYLQSPNWFTRYYKMGHSYDTHPYEIKAYAEEENWKNFIGK